MWYASGAMRSSGSVVRLRGAALAAALGVALSMAATPARAQPRDNAPASAADREAAQRAFAQGQRAYRVGDFRRAAESFESAYAHVPHPDALWNAARAWHRARELSRAANLYARFLREAPPNSRDRNSATTALKDLAARIARIDVVAPDFQELRVDGAELDGTSIYVTPGDHVVAGVIDGRPVRQTSKVAAGDVVSVALVPPSAPPVVATATPPPPVQNNPATTPTKEQPTHDEPKTEEKKGGGGLPPTIVYVGGAATVLAGAFTIWSGLDTNKARSDFNGTQQALDDGIAKEHRTNIALAVTGVLGAFTLVSAAFLVDWGGGRSTKKSDSASAAGGPTMMIGVGPGTISASGRF
jgi:hypothetical protein